MFLKPFYASNNHHRLHPHHHYLNLPFHIYHLVLNTQFLPLGQDWVSLTHHPSHLVHLTSHFIPLNCPFHLSLLYFLTFLCHNYFHSNTFQSTPTQIHFIPDFPPPQFYSLNCHFHQDSSFYKPTKMDLPIVNEEDVTGWLPMAKRYDWVQRIPPLEQV